MAKVIEGKLDGTGLKFGLVQSRFNEFITGRLVEGAVDALVRHGVKDNDITIAKVPGSWEIPAAAKRMVASGKFDAVICIGCVIRGATPHFDYVAAEAAKGVAHVGLDADIPVLFGVLTTDTIEQAVERAGTKAGNKGWDAAMGALEMAQLYKQLG